MVNRKKNELCLVSLGTSGHFSSPLASSSHAHSSISKASSLSPESQLFSGLEAGNPQGTSSYYILVELSALDVKSHIWGDESQWLEFKSHVWISRSLPDRSPIQHAPGHRCLSTPPGPSTNLIPKATPPFLRFETTLRSSISPTLRDL